MGRTAGLQFVVIAALALGAGSAAGQELHVGLQGGPSAIDPQFSALGTNTGTLRNIFDTLVGQNATLGLVPGLAESWEAEDETTWLFHLRQGVRFHDGHPFTAEDVKFSIERIPSAAGPDGGGNFFIRRIASTEIVDDHTIRIRTSSPAPDLPVDLATLFIISHEAAAGATIDSFNQGPAAIGTGPYKFVSWTPLGDLVLTRNDDYWGGTPEFAEVTLSEISDDAARISALLSGRVDLIAAVPPSAVAELRDDQEIAVFSGPSAYQFFLWPDQAETSPLVTAKDGSALPQNPLRDTRVREALSLAIDRPLIAAQVTDGLSIPAGQLIPDGFFGSIGGQPSLAYDVNEAKRLLAEAGYPDGFHIELHCTSDRLPNDGRICAALGQLFAAIGVDTGVNATPKAILFPAFVQRQYVLTMAGWGTLTGEAGYTLAGAVHTTDEARELGTANRTAYSNAAVDAAIEDAIVAVDPDERAALLADAMKLAVEDYALIPIVTLTANWAGRSDRVVYDPRADEATLAVGAHLPAD